MAPMEEEGTEADLGLRLLRAAALHSPSAAGIERVREFYRREYSLELTEAEGREVLHRAVRILAAQAAIGLELEAAEAEGAQQT